MGGRARRLAALVSIGALLGLAWPPGQAVAAPAVAACPAPTRLTEFLWGTAATHTSQAAADAAAALGHRWVRYPLQWGVLEPTLAAAPRITRADVDARPSLIDDFTARADWAPLDEGLAHNRDLGLSTIGFVGGNGGDYTPLLNGERVNPDNIGGRRYYLGYQYLVARATVERYDGDGVDDAPNGVSLDLWQTENELNGAAIAALIGWRTPGGLFDTDTAWRDFDFLTALLTTLRAGVMGSDPEAPTMLNFFTDLHPNFAALLGQPTWQEAVRRWRGLVDIVGFDTYPNYYQAGPVDGGIVGAKAREIRSLACAGQPVVVVETGYPNLPSQRGFSPARQAEYYREAWQSARCAQVDGFLPFDLSAGADQHFSATDLARLETAGAALADGDIAALLGLYRDHAAWVTDRMPVLLQSVESHWGLYDAAGAPLPALDVIRAIEAELGPELQPDPPGPECTAVPDPGDVPPGPAPPPVPIAVTPTFTG